MLTEWFDTNAVVKQSDYFSPIMFGIIIKNDIADDVKSVNTGIERDGQDICVLLYADDFVLYYYLVILKFAITKYAIRRASKAQSIVMY